MLRTTRRSTPPEPAKKRLRVAVAKPLSRNGRGSAALEVCGKGPPTATCAVSPAVDEDHRDHGQETAAEPGGGDLSKSEEA